MSLVVDREPRLTVHRTVHRMIFPILSSFYDIYMPQTSRILKLERGRSGGDEIELWYERERAIDELSDVVKVRLHIHGTGHDVAPGQRHVGTVVMPDGFVWHIYLEVL